MPSIKFKENWEESLQLFDAWFNHKPTGRPLMNLLAVREPDKCLSTGFSSIDYDSPEDMYLNTDKVFSNLMYESQNTHFMAEAFPQFSMNLGAGSMALYLGSQPSFAYDTLWFSHFLEDYASLPLRFDPDNYWFKKHLEITRRQVELIKDTDIMVCIPDIIENIDIISAIRDPQTCCLDLYDHPDELKSALQNISEIYTKYYDSFYELVKKPNQTVAYTAAGIFCTGKTGKIQCDFSAMLSPSQFDEFILPSIKRQCDEIPNNLYHLDGPECLCHVDSLMAIEKLKILQWTSGTRNPRGGDEAWYDLYKKARSADKGLCILLNEYSVEESIYRADALVKKFGANGLFFHFPVMSQKQAEALMIKADREWK